jgi:hypothetical protein
MTLKNNLYFRRQKLDQWTVPIIQTPGDGTGGTPSELLRGRWAEGKKIIIERHTRGMLGLTAPFFLTFIIIPFKLRNYE